LPEAHGERLRNLSLLKRRLDAATGKSGRIDMLANELARRCATTLGYTPKERRGRFYFSNFH